MPGTDILRRCAVERTGRVMQVEGMFDLPPAGESVQRWTVNAPIPDDWSVGVIVGPSGAGKSTVARELFGECAIRGQVWEEGKSVLDGFPAGCGIKDITGLLSSVGFSSPPYWLRPFHVLSTGQQFRVGVARALAENRPVTLVDEFTSVVDRTVAKIGSAAIARAVRARKARFVAVTCHYDVLEWLAPDWVYQPHLDRFNLTRGLLRRPGIEITIRQVDRTAWNLFKQHHYMSSEINKTAKCFVAFVAGVAAGFTSYIHFPHAQEARYKREHRTVVLPDFQGVGLGNRLSEWLGAKLTSEGCRFISTTSHPAMIRHRYCSPLWRVHRQMQRANPQEASDTFGGSRSSARYTAGFEYLCRKEASPPLELTRENAPSHATSALVLRDIIGPQSEGVQAHDGLLAQAAGGTEL